MFMSKLLNLNLDSRAVRIVMMRQSFGIGSVGRVGLGDMCGSAAKYLASHIQ